MASDKPVILFIHGGWHTLQHYQTLLDIVKAKGYEVIAPDLPSSLEPTPENPAEADIKLFSDTARELANKGHEIIAVAHSYGGLVATEAFSGLGVDARKAQGVPGGVRALIYVAGFLLAKGMTLESSAPAETLGWCAYENDSKILVEGHDIGSVFYPDLLREEQEKWLRLIVKHPKALSFYSPKKLSYTEIDTVFIYCEKDTAFPYEAQKGMVQAMRNEGVLIYEETLPSGHFPSLSMPHGLAGIICKYA